jgi:cell division protein FtsL
MRQATYQQEIKQSINNIAKIERQFTFAMVTLFAIVAVGMMVVL